MNEKRLKTEYLCWLMNRIGLEAEGNDGYLRFCEILQDTEFLPILEMDENRSAECMELRSDFAKDYDDPVCDLLDDIYGANGTMMEIMIVLSEKMNYEMTDSQFEASPRKWFLELIGNCGLDNYCTNEDFEKEENEELVRDILHTVIFRLTGWDGEGGLFPLMYAQTDQRRLELITQMNNYLEENYDIC